MSDDKKEKMIAAHKIANEKWARRLKEEGYVILQTRILPKYKQQIKDYIKKLHVEKN